MKTFISIMLLLVVANLSFADDFRYYDVEIIVTENLGDTGRNAENWPLQVNLVQEEKTVELGQPVTAEWLPDDVNLKASYKLLNSSHYHLNDLVEKITESKTKRVILHTAWRQPGLDKKTSLPIHFKYLVPAAPVIDDETNPNIINQREEEAETATLPIQNSPSILEGILRVTLARYLHLESELTLQSQLPELIKTDNPFEDLDNENIRSELEKQGVIHFKQKRHRIRSNELHYLDHPVLGILIKITKYELPEKVTQLKK
ncbi:MAG: CsiV family protein [Woeseiaceae bacterium]